MAGGLYGKIQSVRIGHNMLAIQESERLRFLANQKEDAARMMKERSEIHDNMGEMKTEGYYKKMGVDIMLNAKKDKVNLYNNNKKGSVTDGDYIIMASEIDAIPDKWSAVSEITNAKIAELANGDEKLNADELNRLTFAGAKGSGNYNYETKDIDITVKSYDENGKETTNIIPSEKYLSGVAAIRVIPKQGDVNKLARDIGTQYIADKIKTDGPNGGLTTQGLLTGDSQKELDVLFKGAFGNREDGTNFKVLKAKTKDYTYGEAWDMLKSQTEASVRDSSSETYRAPKTTTSAKSPDADLDKMNFTILSKEGKGNKPETKIVAADGNVEGIGATFKMSDTGQKFDLSADSLEGIPEGVADNIKVNAIFIGDDGDIYVKGSAKQLDPMLEMLKNADNLSDDNQKMLETLMEKRSRGVDWIKVKGVGADDIRSNIFNGRSTKEMSTYLRGINGEEPTSGGMTDEEYQKFLNSIQ